MKRFSTLHYFSIFCFTFLLFGGAVLYAVDLSNPRKLNEAGYLALDRGDYPAAVDAFRSAIRLNPSMLEARMGIAEAMYLMAEYEDAYREMDLTKPLAPGYIQRILLEARILAALGKYDEAIVLYRDVLDRRPYDGEANQGLGEIYAIQGQRELANDAYSKSLQYNPDNLRALLQLVLLHDGAREKTSAGNALQEALTRYPDNFTVRIHAAEHFVLYREWDAAAQHLEAAMGFLGNARDSRYNQLIRLQAALALQRGDPAVAETVLESMTDANEQAALFLKARTYRALGKEELAQQVLELLLRMNPEDEITHIYRENPFIHSIDGLEKYRQRAAHRYIDKGKKFEENFYYSKALDAYRVARRINSMNPDIWLSLANIIRLMGFPQKYRDELNAAIMELDSNPAKKSRSPGKVGFAGSLNQR